VKLGEIVERLSLESLTPQLQPSSAVEVLGGFASDLLSDVLANAPRRGVLVTIQVHMNVVAVALHAELAAVIFSSGRVPEEKVRQKAVEEGIALYSSRESSFDVAGRLYALGLRGPHA
jgi:hypothetical protein